MGKQKQETDSPTVWFAVLERARLTNDFDLAARAQSELKRLGVVVRYSRRMRAYGTGNNERTVQAF